MGAFSSRVLRMIGLPHPRPGAAARGAVLYTARISEAFPGSSFVAVAIVRSQTSTNDPSRLPLNFKMVNLNRDHNFPVRARVASFVLQQKHRKRAGIDDPPAVGKVKPSRQQDQRALNLFLS